MKHTTDQVIAVISGFSFSTAYTVVYHIVGQVQVMSIWDLTYAVCKAAAIGLVGAMFGLVGKDLYNWIKNKIRK